MSRLRGALYAWRALKRRLTMRIFVCYRRDGAGAGYALDLRNRLAAVIGTGNVFLDVAGNAIAVGEDWRRKVNDAIDRSRIVVVMVDSGSWTERLSNPDDAVRFELSAALAGREQGGLQIFPVLVGDARMPAASEFPAPLAEFPRLSASHIRTATADEDVDGIVRRLIGRSSRVPTAAPDRVDALIAVAAAAAAIAVWLSFFRAQFNTNEKWLWGAAVGVAIVAVSALRRAIAGWHLGASEAWRQAAILVAIVVGGTAACYAGYRLVYHVPQFSETGVGGFLLARFSGDPNDSARANFATALARIINAESVPRYLRVPPDNIPDRRLNQRLGLVTDTSNPLILLLPHRVRDEDDAKEYAAASRASIVVWGSTERPGELDISVSFAPENEPIDEVPAGVVGSTDIHSISRKPVDLVDVETVQRALVWLLAGYRKYRARGPEYDDALASFANGLQALDKLTVEQQKGLVGALKATLSLYAGNALLFRGNPSDAAAAYRVAEKLSTVGKTHLFVEPVNNLAYLARAQGNSYPTSAPGDGSSARELLQGVLRECAETTQIPRSGCAYVWYNLGATFHDEADAEDDDVKARDLYAQAGELFQNTVDMLNPC
ncbi:MAG: toll/interleukin-1 receptor domain-containing protein, partial [Acidobacteriota bacterium]